MKIEFSYIINRLQQKCKEQYVSGFDRSLLQKVYFDSGPKPGLHGTRTPHADTTTTALSVMHHPASGISFPRNFACLQITKTYHSHLISHMSVRLFLHHHCHHPLLLLTSTPDSKLIFSTNLSLHSSSTFPPTGLTPRTPAVFRFSRACRF